MRKGVRVTAILLVLVFVFSTVSVMAVEPRASYYLDSYGGATYHLGGGELKVSFHVWGTNRMDDIGATKVVLQYSHDNSNWEDLKTFKYTDAGYSDMMSSGKLYYHSYVLYEWIVGLYYRAEITIYAGNDGAGDSRTFTTSSVFASVTG